LTETLTNPGWLPERRDWAEAFAQARAGSLEHTAGVVRDHHSKLGFELVSEGL
jgi:hypothetical protein